MGPRGPVGPRMLEPPTESFGATAPSPDVEPARGDPGRTKAPRGLAHKCRQCPRELKGERTRGLHDSKPEGHGRQSVRQEATMSAMKAVEAGGAARPITLRSFTDS
eukprot:8849570-Pyramimonas_sp.AAC.1